MSSPLRIAVVGATGLVGTTLIEQAVHRSDVRIVGIARREMKLPHGARMEMLLADPSGWPDAVAASGASVLVCALGTTMAKVARDEAAFRAVDHDLVLHAAKAAQAAGIDHMIVVSSVGADTGSPHFYLRVKGETEVALARLRFRRLDVVRPGLLRGPRAERRPLERVAQVLAPLADLLLHGKRRPFRSIRVDVLAEAIFALAFERAGGHFIHAHDDLLRAIRRAHIGRLHA